MITPDFGVDTTTAQSRQVANPITELLPHHAIEPITEALEVEVQAIIK